MELLNPLADADFPAKSISYTGSAGVTGAWPAGPQGVVVWSDQACYVLVGEGVVGAAQPVDILAELAGCHLLGRLEHQVFKEMGDAVLARLAIRRPHLVDHHLVDDGSEVAGQHHDLHAVLEREALGIEHLGHGRQRGHEAKTKAGAQGCRPQETIELL